MNKTSVRRKIIKGSLSAPLVMTVSAAQGASLSSFTSCLNNAAGQPKPSNVLATQSSSDDGWMRVRIDVYKVKTPNQWGNLIEREGRYFIGPNKTTFFKLASSNPSSTPATIVSDFNANTYGLQKTVVERRYALAYIGDKANVLGYAWQPNGGTHCKKSCYSSLLTQATRQRWI